MSDRAVSRPPLAATAKPLHPPGGRGPRSHRPSARRWTSTLSPPALGDPEAPGRRGAVGGAAGGAGLDPKDVAAGPQAPGDEGRATAPEAAPVELAEEGRPRPARGEAEDRGAATHDPSWPAAEPGLRPAPLQALSLALRR